MSDLQFSANWSEDYSAPVIEWHTDLKNTLTVIVEKNVLSIAGMVDGKTYCSTVQNSERGWAWVNAIASQLNAKQSALQKRVEELEAKVKRVEALADNWDKRLKAAECNGCHDCVEWSRWKMCEQELKDALEEKK